MRKLFQRLRELRRFLAVAECCGIAGYCGTEEARKILVDSIELLQNRGYDSCGVSTMGSDRKILTTKFASRGSTSDCVELLKKSVPDRHPKEHTIGIAHTRWATHGGKTDTNAHPHMDYKRRISVVHNGTIDNFEEIKRRLMEERKIPFESQTDTEVIANLIGAYLDDDYPFQDAVAKSVDELRGTWGLLVMHKDDPNGFMCARNGSPLILAAGAEQVFVASEPLALARYTNEYLSLKDGDVCYVNREKGIAHLENGRDKQAIPQQEIATEPIPFRHWTIKEIYEQPQAIARALSFGGRIATLDGHRVVKLGGLSESRDELLKIKNLVITGCGTSYYAGMYGELLFRYLDAFQSINLVDSSDVEPFHFGKPSSSGILALSQSGETRDVVQALEHAEALGVRKFSIVNQVGSLVARMTGCGVYLHAGREVAVASTKAFTSQVVALALISVWFAQNRKECERQTNASALMAALTRMPSIASEIIASEPYFQKLAAQLSTAESIFVLGKGFGYPVALEGALKIKEISYVHAEGYGGGQLKHGPFALIDEKKQTPIIMIVLNDSQAPAMINAAQQVKARGARLICITDKPALIAGVADHTIEIPQNGPLTALGAVIPLQIIAYHMALKRDINPDKPRGLAKTVTVA